LLAQVMVVPHLLTVRQDCPNPQVWPRSSWISPARQTGRARQTIGRGMAQVMVLPHTVTERQVWLEPQLWPASSRLSPARHEGTARQVTGTGAVAL
jgi:hypothetical protein